MPRWQLAFNHPLDVTLLLEVDVKPLLIKSFPGGFNRASDVPLLRLQGEAYRPNEQAVLLVHTRVHVASQIKMGLNGKPRLT